MEPYIKRTELWEIDDELGKRTAVVEVLSDETVKVAYELLVEMLEKAGFKKGL